MPYQPDEQTQALVDAFKRAIKRIQNELNRIDLTDFQRANANAVMASISEILTKLNEETAAWVEANVPIAARAGVAESIVALGVVETLAEANTIVKFNRVNKALVEAVIADTQADLLAVTTNVERKVRAAVRQVTSEVLRENLAAGINGKKTIRGEILANLRSKLGASLNTGIIDSAGRRWDPSVYTEMLTRTKLMRTHIEATMNEAISRDALYGIISSHGARDACRNYEGKIVKLTADAPGSYPYIGNLLGGPSIFHPRCKHTVSPIRNLDRYI
jgi:Phage minor capsid protein 2